MVGGWSLLLGVALGSGREVDPLVICGERVLRKLLGKEKKRKGKEIEKG